MNMSDSPSADNRDLFEQMIRSFESAGMPYCILAGYDTYPEQIPSDIDFMVDPAWNHRLPTIIAAIANVCGAHLIQAIKHETTATYFVLARRHGAELTYLHPDSSTDYRRQGQLWLNARRVLENRRRHPQGFWIPSAADALAYYLIKKLDKGSLDESQARQLAMRYAEDSRAGREVLRKLLPRQDATMLEAAIRSTAPFSALPWSTVNACLPQFKEALHDRASHEPMRLRLRQAWRDLLRTWDRLRRPTGLSIAFLGPDGSGKSTVIDRVSQQLAQAFRQVEYRHLRPGPLPAAPTPHKPVTDPHAQPPRGRIGSIVKLLHFWARYWSGTLCWLYPRRVCSTLVLIDRYYHDLIADPRRYRYSASLKLARWLGRCLPQPDMAFILDAPPEALQARKQEVPFAESARQRCAYLKLANEFRQASVIDASQPIDQVVATILGHIVMVMEQRTTRRLGLNRSRSFNFRNSA